MFTMSASIKIPIAPILQKATIKITVETPGETTPKIFSGSLKDARKIWDEAFEFMASAEAAFETDNDLPDEELPLR